MNFNEVLIDVKLFHCLLKSLVKMLPWQLFFLLYTGDPTLDARLAAEQEELTNSYYYIQVTLH